MTPKREQVLSDTKVHVRRVRDEITLRCKSPRTTDSQKEWEKRRKDIQHLDDALSYNLIEGASELAFNALTITGRLDGGRGFERTREVLIRFCRTFPPAGMTAREVHLEVDNRRITRLTQRNKPHYKINGYLQECR